MPRWHWHGVPSLFCGGVFDPEAVTIEKQMLKKALEDEINEKRIYCQRQANREFLGAAPPVSGRRAIWTRWTA